MAAKGFRLVGTTRLAYDFTRCEPSQFAYKVEYVGEKSYNQAKEYQQFLHEMGLRTFAKNMKLNYSLGKIQWRPYAQGRGMIATSPGSINRELLIVEKQADGKPFELHTDQGDLISYYRNIRRAYLYGLIAVVALIVLGSTSNEALHLAGFIVNVIASGLGVVLALLLIRYSRLLYTLKKKAKVRE